MRWCKYVLLLLSSSVCLCVSARDRSAWVVDDHGCITPENGAGFCTEIKSCETVTYLMEKVDFDKDKTQAILEEFACGVDKTGHLKVCCPYKPLLVQGPNAIDHLNHPNLRLLPSDCGMVNAWGLPGGEANLFEFGWSVLLRYRRNGERFLCGGSLISDRYVLTSASCIKLNLIGVRIGEQHLKTVKDCTKEYSSGDTIEICGPSHVDLPISQKDVTIHPQYDSSNFDNNLALIRLPNRVNTSLDNIATICLPITSEEKSHHVKKYTAIGWGATDEGVYSSKLLKIIAEKIQGGATCTSYYQGKIGRALLNQICVKALDDGGFCAEDLGGPLMGYFDKDLEIKTIQYGVLSIRPKSCVQRPLPTVYTSTVPYVGWILDNLKP